MSGGSGKGLDLFRLDGRVALVTGGSRGLGKAVALGLAGAGADVAVAGRTMDDLEQTVAEAQAGGRQALAIRADLSRGEEVRAVAATALDHFGRVDILVNNAAVLPETELLELTESEWDRVLDTNLKAAFLLSQAIARVMVTRGGGAIVNVASYNSVRGAAGLGAYTASKGGLLTLTKTMAIEWARHGIRVNAVCPGWIRTDLNSKFLDTPYGERMVRSTVPMMRAGRPDELIGAVIYLASDAAAYVTGAALFIDGGKSAK
ncbi:MAG: SDR family NAD(P)-dependent oxidoreductase [Candidatus Rokubacteria bacterium]|nr:SDR family NAD(P)-dependent oxidoreductase [Candidatus Rokubacteria bacterium]